MTNPNWEHIDDWTLETLGLPEGYIPAWFGQSGLTTSDQRWNAEKGGVFLFFKITIPVDFNLLKERLVEFLKAPVHSSVRFLWIENPTEPIIHWRTDSISIQVQKEDNKEDVHMVRHRAFLSFRNYSFTIERGVTIDKSVVIFEEEEEEVTMVSFSAIEIPAPGFMWSTQYLEHSFFDITNVTLPLTGDEAGCIKFDFSIPRIVEEDETFGYPGLEQLDIGMRIFFRDPEFPESGDKFFLASHRYPLLQESYGNDDAFAFFPDHIGWNVCLDLLYPLSRSRSFFEFLLLEDPADFGFDPEIEEEQIPGLPSAYRTNRGYTVHLIPQKGESRLYFTPRPATLRIEDLPEAPLYLVPSGRFKLKVPKYVPNNPFTFVPEANVICGISGLEYIKVKDNENSFLILKEDQAAFAPAFVSAYSLLRDLKDIIESHVENGNTLDEDTTDQDMPIEEEFSNGLGIDDSKREEILNTVRLTYFPSGYEFSEAARTEFMSLEIVEEMINWLRETLQTEAVFGGGEDGLVSYPFNKDEPDMLRFPTTSWAYFDEVDGTTTYFSQPDQAVLYKAESSSTEFLDFLEVPALGLPQAIDIDQTKTLKTRTTHASLSFPMLPYGSVDSGRLTDMRQFENLLINNFRFNRIREINHATNYSTALKISGSGTNFKGTTPQGLIASYSPDPNFPGALQISTLQLAMNWNQTLVQMSNIPHNAALKAVLQSNQLFMVISNPKDIEPFFTTDAQVDIEDWKFELGAGADNWDKNGTIMVFKFHDKSLMELASKPDLWSLPDDFNQSKEMASLALQDFVNAALENGASKDPKERKKYAAILPAITQANWTGILAFNVTVPLGNLPDQLAALAGGMNPDLFYAQYVGIEVTPVESSGTDLFPKPSSMFALIDYQNNIVPEADLSGYNFHVPFLTVVFRNSLITDFAAEVQLFMEYLFHEEAFLLNSPFGGNMISLIGVAEKQNGKTTYSFGFSGANRFELSGKVMQEVEIVKAQFATDPLLNPRPNPLPITGRFFLWGRIKFVHFEDFDVLSFGPETDPADPSLPDYLSMSNLQITMSFNLYSETPDERARVADKIFKFKTQQMAFDLNQSGARLQSLYEKFPLKFKGFKTVTSDPNALTSSGYMPVNSLLKTVALGETWYGLEYDLNLGSAGALAGSTGLVAGILVAWNPEEEGIYLGLKLPGSTGGKKEITVQGLLKIAFKSIRFESYKDPKSEIPDNRGYLLKLKNIVIKFMVVSFPPSGQTEIILFGDPRSKEEVPLRKDKLLGWYASYVKK